MRRRPAAGWGLALAAVSWSVPSTANLPGDVDALRTRYEASGAATLLLKPRVLSSGGALPLALPEVALADPALPCTTVTVLGASSTVFALRLPAMPGSRSPVEAVPSSVGWAAVTRCAGDRAHLQDLGLEMRSPHAVIEALVVRTATAAAAREVDPRAVLRGRDPGVRPRAASMPPPPAPLPIDARARAVEAAMARDGFGRVRRTEVQASPRGAGELSIELGAGCHRISVLGIPHDGNAAFRDLDAELVLASGERITDRSESPDARLVACVGEEQEVGLSFAGAPPAARVVVSMGERALPDGIPEAFDPETTARLGRALLRHRAPSPAREPLLATFGVQGRTRIPLRIERGRCYLLAVAHMDRPPRLLSAVLTLGTEVSESHTADPETEGGVAAAACARTGSEGAVEVEALGGGEWALALWPLARAPLGARRR